MSGVLLTHRLHSLLTDNPIYQNKYTRLGFFASGVQLVLSKVLSYTRAILTPVFRFQRDLAVRYGKGSWALITGASDGIGKGYVFELARRGFNIVLVGRNEEKLKTVEKELKLAVPQTQTRIVVSDFVNSYKEGFAEDIHKQVSGLDISVLINNVGIASGSQLLHQVPRETIVNVVMTNCLAHALITRVFLPQLTVRTNKSAIINTSAIAGSMPMPYGTIYSSSKVFHDFLSRGLNYEHPDLDILSVKPGSVSTKGTGNPAIGPLTITVEGLRVNHSKSARLSKPFIWALET